MSDPILTIQTDSSQPPKLYWTDVFLVKLMVKIGLVSRTAYGPYKPLSYDKESSWRHEYRWFWK